MEPRYVIRPDRDGYSVRDLWTGQPAILAGMPQKGLSQEDADHTANLLNGPPPSPSTPTEPLSA